MFIITISNAIIVVQLIRRKNELRQLSQENSLDTFRLTLTLLAVSIVFILLTLPLGIMYCIPDWIVYPQTVEELQREKKIYVAVSVFTLLDYINNGCNFWLYCLTGKQLRHQFKQRFCKRCLTTPTA